MNFSPNPPLDFLQGLAITKAVLAQGKRVVAVDREVNALDEIASSLLVPRVCDLRDSCQV